MGGYGSLFVSFLRFVSTGTGILNGKLWASSTSFRVADRTLAVLPAVGLALLALSSTRALAAVSLDTRISQDQNFASTAVTTGAFSTTAGNELLLAFVATDSTGSPNTTVQRVSGAGVSWVLVSRSNTQSGTAEIWRAFAPEALQGVSVAAALSQSVQSSLTVMTFAGVDPSGSNGSGAVGAVATGNSADGAPAASLVSTRNSSVIVGVGNDYDQAIARVPVAGQAIVHQSLAAAGDTYWVQWQSSPVPLSGSTVQFGDSYPSTDRYNVSICEVLPAPAASGAKIQPSTSALSYGTVTNGTTVTQPLTLTSTGGAAVTLSSASVSGSGFALQAANFPVTLASGHSLTLQIGFDPQIAGAVNGALQVNSNATNGSLTTVQLSGTGSVAATSPQLTLSTSSLSFGNVTAGGSSLKPVTLSSTGSSPVTISSESKTGAPFKLRNISYPLTLNPGQSASFQVAFQPLSAGSQSGQVSVVSNSLQKSTATIALSGTGVAAQHSVSLTWSPPTSSPVQVSGYNIYRAVGSGSYALMNAAPKAAAAYTDSTVIGGGKYSYEVKSVAGGSESAPSAPITATIPIP